MRAGSDVNTQQVIELVQRTIGFAVQDATEIAAGLASCKELIIPNLIDSAAIASAHAASNAGVQCDLNPKSNGICSKQSGPRKKAGGGVVRPNRRYSVNGITAVWAYIPLKSAAQDGVPARRLWTLYWPKEKS
jgi:hypothetical protein